MAAPDHEGATLVTIGKRRLLSTLVTAMTSIAALMLFAATPASADYLCNGGASVSLQISPPYTYDVYLGIDIPMSQPEAQAIINAPGEPFSAVMFGEDPSSNDYLFSMPASPPIAWSGGLSSEFSVTVDDSDLDEDDSWFDDRDEVFAEIQLYDGRSGTTCTYRSGTIRRYF